MPSWTNHKAYIYEYGSGDYPGGLVGTITNILAQGAAGTNNLDEAGDGWLIVHGSDTPSVALCQDFRIARVTAVSSISGSEHEICCFIIRKREPRIIKDQVIITVSGPDFIGSTKWGTPVYNEISDLAGGPSSTPIQDALLYTNKAWTVTNHGTVANGAVWVGAAEKTYEVIQGLLQQQGAHFSFALKDNPVFEMHVWYEFTETAPTGFDALTLLETDDPASYQADPNTAIITEPIRVIREYQEIFTRAYVYGAGMGADAWTIEQMNLGPIVIAGWGVNSAQSLIINQALEATIPEVTTVKKFPYLEPIDPEDDTAVQTNARAIFYSGINWLGSRAKATIEYYEIPNVIIHADILPGQLVHVTYNRVSPIDSGGSLNETEIVALDDDLIVLGIQHKIGKGGVRYTDLLVGETPKPLARGLDMMATKIKELDDTVKHTSAPSGGGGAPSGGGDSSSYLWASGSGPVLTGDLDVADLVTIDGVDLSAHAASPTAHHTPGTIGVGTTNANTGTEYHEVESSSDPGVQAILVQTDAGGRVVLVRADLDSLVLTDRDDGQKYNIFINAGRVYIEPVS